DANVCAPFADRDGDGVADYEDNCIDQPNTSQFNQDEDAFGNACDGDFNNSGQTDLADLGLFKAALLTSRPAMDFNADGIVNIIDIGVFKRLFLRPPGPSALAP
ncbi:MAG: dockerin type I domain-containing protein, partial [Gammaproteobacteria bacterium]